MCLRGDTDFSLTANFDRWAKQVDFIFGMDNSPRLRSRADALHESRWTRLSRPAPYQTLTGATRAWCENTMQRIVTERGYLNLELNYEDVAEFDYRPGKCSRFYHVVALRKNIGRSHGDQLLFDEVRYFFYITTRTDLTADEIVACANERCDQETSSDNSSLV